MSLLWQDVIHDRWNTAHTQSMTLKKLEAIPLNLTLSNGT